MTETVADQSSDVIYDAITGNKIVINGVLEQKIYKYLSKYGDTTRQDLCNNLKHSRTTIWNAIERLMALNLVWSYPREKEIRGRPQIYFLLIGQNPKYKISESRNIHKLKEWHDPRIWILEILDSGQNKTVKQLSMKTGLGRSTIAHHIGYYLFPNELVSLSYKVYFDKHNTPIQSKSYSITPKGTKVIEHIHKHQITRWKFITDLSSL